jgi:hypothetical protein
MNNKEHLTKEGLDKIISIRGSINKRLSGKSKTLVTKIPDPNWLVGFVDGEGCFFINIQRSSDQKVGFIISLKFQITQHLRDKLLMESLIQYLDCGRIQKESKRSIVNFIVSKFDDINNRIIPFFCKYSLRSNKVKDYLDFCKACNLIKDRSHLTEKGLIELRKIKLGMNKGRFI